MVLQGETKYAFLLYLSFVFQYNTAGWAPKEYNADDKQSTSSHGQNANTQAQKSGSTSQCGFVWDEKSGYYYDAASGFYYDGNTGERLVTKFHSPLY